ncbi:MAG TPA: S8 family serine peptidase, partial [Chitinophagaceae bacterium]|nr:S8 family serine peptidase [Chitinophagaceae bacterium]
MEPNRLLLLAAFLLLRPLLSPAQQPPPVLRLGHARFATAPNITTAVDSFNRKHVPGKKEFAVLQFDELPAPALRRELAAAGVELLEYVPDRAYTVLLSAKLNAGLLQKARARTLHRPTPKQKMHPDLAAGRIPPHAVQGGGTVDTWISFPASYRAEEVMAGLRSAGIAVTRHDLKAYRVLHVRVPAGRIEELAGFSFVEYVQPAPPADQPLNFNSRALSRSGALTGSVANGGLGLNGAGVVVGVGDNSDPQTHPDFLGRIISRSPVPPAGHGNHVTGTVGGAGNLNELYRGYAPGATIIGQLFGGIFLNAALYVQDYGMVITNNSYGALLGCSNNGVYDLYSRILDQQAFEFPHLQQVFAAGNSGLDACAPYATGYHTVLGGYQAAKNVITVGATNDSGLIRPSSSRGPVRDGRLKPELTAMGDFVASTWTSGYGYGSGTSMAAPAVSGGLALLYQRYRQLFGGANPKSGLMKALVCNGAQDFANPGPDFQHGFGNLHLVRSADMLEQGRYFNATVLPGGTNTHTITVPANTARLKVMLYWHDPAASVLSSRTLVNDLDLELTDPGNALSLPLVLDTAAAALGNAAVPGADHTNNMEQVVREAPAAGTYTLRVKGTAIAQNPSQEYFLVYDIIPQSVTLTHPFGGETFLPTDVALNATKVSWDAYGNASSTYTLQWTANGTTWSNMATGLAAGRRLFTWWIPDTVTDKAQVRVIQDATGLTHTSQPFVILKAPTVSLAPVQCEGYINMNWTAVNGATDYEVMILRGGTEMRPVAVTAGTNYAIGGLSKDSTYWVSVRPRINGKPGRRGVAISRLPATGTCAGTLSNGDLKLNGFVAPYSGREFTASQLGAAAPVTVQVKNLDDVPVTGFTLRYSLNGGPWVTEALGATIAARGLFNHTFATPANLSATGNYLLKAEVINNAADPVKENDTVTVVLRHLANGPVSLAAPFTDDLETAASGVYLKDTTGLAGLDRYDFFNSTVNGRLRTFINSGLAYSGQRALTLDADRYVAAGNTNYLTGTFNLGGYQA